MSAKIACSIFQAPTVTYFLLFSPFGISLKEGSYNSVAIVLIVYEMLDVVPDFATLYFFLGQLLWTCSLFLRD
jgi:hypothetical protein